MTKAMDGQHPLNTCMKGFDSQVRGRPLSPLFNQSETTIGTGQSVYWQNIFKKYKDPTFVLLAFIWHTLYAWDEALEHLYAHICKIVSIVFGFRVNDPDSIISTQEGETIATRELALTEELHSIRAHLYHYSSLLNDVRKSVNFLKSTKTPIKYSPNGNEVLDRECDNLLAEIDRLESGRQMQDQRLKNVMNLV